MVGLVTTLEGEPLPSGDIASRLGGFGRQSPRSETDADHRRGDHRRAARLEERAAQQLPGLPGVPGRRGPHRAAARPVLYGRYLLNPFLVRVELVPMLGREPGTGRRSSRASSDCPQLDHLRREFKFGASCGPAPRHLAGAAAHREVRDQPRASTPPNRARRHLTLKLGRPPHRRRTTRRPAGADRGKSREGFVFTIDLQVQIHVPDTRRRR
jgi:hypothetical protein